MATSFKGWGTSWGSHWGSVTTDPGAAYGSAGFTLTATAQATATFFATGSASLSFSATGDLTNGTVTGGMTGAASYVFGASGDLTALAGLAGSSAFSFSPTGAITALAYGTGSAAFVVTTTGDLINIGSAIGDMTGTASFSITAFATVDVPKQEGMGQGGGPGGAHHFQTTSRNSDPDAYRPERIKERRTVVIAGKEFDVFDPDLEANIEAAARAQEPEDMPEVVRQDRKLSRSFTVDTPQGRIEVPLFRPLLDELPDLRRAAASDLKRYAEKVAAERAEERRRVMLLLLAVE